MSATNRGGTVIPSGSYPTPPIAVRRLLAEINLPGRDFMWGETGAGMGNIIREFVRAGVEPAQWEWAELAEGIDYLKDGLTGPVDGIVQNPDFSIAQEVVTKALVDAPGFVATLLRLNFFGGQVRHDWWQGMEPSHLFPLSKRPSFVDVCKGRSPKKIKSCGAKYESGTRTVCPCGGTVAAGTDATDYAWFVWDGYGICRRPPGMYVV